MDGFIPLVLDEEQALTVASATVPAAEKGDWIAVRAGDSALIMWFPAGE